jgi:hypothetical protein
MRLLALDLSLTATGLLVVDSAALATDDEQRARAALARMTIKTPQRLKHESLFEWNQRRFRYFLGVLEGVLKYEADIMVTEVSSGVFNYRKTEANEARYGPGVQFRAGTGLGHALGWLDAAIYAGLIPPRAFPMEVSEVKRRITGNSGATKAAVADSLKTIYGWDLTGWDEAQIDALAVAQAYIQNQEHEQKLEGMSPAQKAAFASFLPSKRKAPRRARA